MESCSTPLPGVQTASGCLHTLIQRGNKSSEAVCWWNAAPHDSGSASGQIAGVGSSSTSSVNEGKGGCGSPYPHAATLMPFATTCPHSLLSTRPNLRYPSSSLSWIHCPAIVIQPSVMMWLDAHIPQRGEGQEWGDWQCSQFALGGWMGIQGDTATSC